MGALKWTIHSEYVSTILHLLCTPCESWTHRNNCHEKEQKTPLEMHFNIRAHDRANPPMSRWLQTRYWSWSPAGLVLYITTHSIYVEWYLVIQVMLHSSSYLTQYDTRTDIKFHLRWTDWTTSSSAIVVTFISLWPPTLSRSSSSKTTFNELNASIHLWTGRWGTQTDMTGQKRSRTVVRRWRWWWWFCCQKRKKFNYRCKYGHEGHTSIAAQFNFC